MFHIHCKLPNASALISGVAFQPHPDRDGVMTTVEPVDEAAARHFGSVEGFEVVDLDAKLSDGGAGRPSNAAMIAQIEALGGKAPEGAKAGDLKALLAELKAKAEAPAQPAQPAPEAAAAEIQPPAAAPEGGEAEEPKE